MTNSQILSRLEELVNEECPLEKGPIENSYVKDIAKVAGLVAFNRPYDAAASCEELVDYYFNRAEQYCALEGRGSKTAAKYTKFSEILEKVAEALMS